MSQRERSYQCRVCQWQGLLEPVDPGDAAPCPQCGVYLYPMSWMQTWGLAILLIAGTAGLVLAAALIRW